MTRLCSEKKLTFSFNIQACAKLFETINLSSFKLGHELFSGHTIEQLLVALAVLFAEVRVRVVGPQGRIADPAPMTSTTSTPHFIASFRLLSL